MAKFDMTQLEKATTIPDGSLHLVEMGDGSGTKAVTQETLAEETGKALKVGNLAELQTEDKTSLVAAINEAAQSGGGGTPVEVDVLDTQEEIEANTEAGKAAGALAVKEMLSALNDKLIALTTNAFRFEGGEVNANIGSSSPTTKVEFKQPFKNTPSVFVQAASTAINLRFAAKDVTVKGFNIYGYYNNSGSEKVRWVAIGN